MAGIEAETSPAHALGSLPLQAGARPSSKKAPLRRLVADRLPCHLLTAGGARFGRQLQGPGQAKRPTMGAARSLGPVQPFIDGQPSRDQASGRIRWVVHTGAGLRPLVGEAIATKSAIWIQELRAQARRWPIACLLGSKTGQSCTSESPRRARSCTGNQIALDWHTMVGWALVTVEASPVGFRAAQPAAPARPPTAAFRFAVWPASTPSGRAFQASNDSTERVGGTAANVRGSWQSPTT